MKLRNKKTGNIIQLNVKCENGGELRTFDLNTNTDKPITLAELNEEWEDYEEPKEGYWYIIEDGTLGRINLSWDTQESIENHKSIGNYFATYKEAEKAVEKLKAWKRLKDKGFRLSAVVDSFFCLDIYMKGKPYEELKEDLKIVFGGEE